MASIFEAGNAINGSVDVMDDYQQTAADLTDAFSNTDYEDTDVEIPISGISTDPEIIAYLNKYDTDGDGHISRDEYNKAMTGLQDLTNTLTNIAAMTAETAEKIAEALLAVAKYF